MSDGDQASTSWPAFSVEAFEPTRHFLHMALQAVGKLKLSEPFHAQWAQVALWLTARGLTTGPIRHVGGVYEIRVDLVSHEVQWITNAGGSGQLPLGPTSVAVFVNALLDGLRHDGVDVSIDFMPQEVPGPVPFDMDTQQRPYDRDSVNAWWRVLLETQRVLGMFQGRFTGKTQPVGLMWGTMDIRLALYSGKPASPDPQAGFIRRNAMNAELMELGWWAGGTPDPKPSFYSFTYPQPAGVENANVRPNAAGWNAGLGEFLLDYDVLRRSADPDRDLLAFLESTYEVGARAANWDPGLLGTGRPV